MDLPLTVVGLTDKVELGEGLSTTAELAIMTGTEDWLNIGLVLLRSEIEDKFFCGGFWVLEKSSAVAFLLTESLAHPVKQLACVVLSWFRGLSRRTLSFLDAVEQESVRSISR